jgi:hypothetical protein
VAKIIGLSEEFGDSFFRVESEQACIVSIDLITKNNYCLNLFFEGSS